MDKCVTIFIEWCNVIDRCYALQLPYTVIIAPCNFVTNSTCYVTQFTMMLHYGTLYVYTHRSCSNHKSTDLLSGVPEFFSIFSIVEWGRLLSQFRKWFLDQWLIPFFCAESVRFRHPTTCKFRIIVNVMKFVCVAALQCCKNIGESNFFVKNFGKFWRTFPKTLK